MQIQADALRGLATEIFVGAGCARAESVNIARHLVAANLAGHDSHGVIRIPRYVEWLRTGRVFAGRELQIVSENEVMAVVDGQFGFGQTIGPQAVRLGIGKARAGGVAVVALRHSGHLGCIGDWARQAAQAGLVSVHFVNVAGARLVAPFGGVERRMSTAPFAAGIPVPGQEPVILDFATSLVAEGKALVAYNGGKPIPPGSVVGPDGALSDDPQLLYGPTAPGELPNPRQGDGALCAMGEHKGSGLAFVCELLAGALTGSGCAGPGQRPVCNGMLSIYLSPAFFASGDAFAEDVKQFVASIKSTRAREPGGEVLVPGEPERRRRDERLADGVPLPQAAWAAIVRTAGEVGLDEPAIDRALRDGPQAATARS